MEGQGKPEELEKDPWNCTSKSVAESVTGSHKFIVKGYSLMKGLGIGKYLSSDVFSVGGHDWEIRFFPDGDETEDVSSTAKTFTSIALVSDDGGTGIRALFELTFLDESGKDVGVGLQRSKKFYTMKKGHEWGYNFKEASLANFKCVYNDCIIIKGIVGVVRTRHEQVEGDKQDDSIAVPHSNLDQGFKELLEYEVCWDIMFHVGDETFRAHKSILAARSPIFRAQFFGPAGDPNLNEVKVDDIHPSIFKAMLVFIYTDELPDVHEIMGSSSTKSSGATNMMQHLLVAADLYNLDQLKVFCESKLSEELKAVSVAMTLALVEQHQCARLKAVCLKFVAHRANLGVMMQSEGFKHLQESCPTLLCELLKTVASKDEDGVVAESRNPSKKRARKRCRLGGRHAYT